MSTVTRGGGAARVARSLHERQRSRGVDSTLLCGLGTEAPDEAVTTLGVERWRHLGNVLLQRLSGREGLLNGRLWADACRRWVDRAEVVHLHNAHGYYLPRPVLDRILTRPTVWTLQDEWLLTGRCAFPLECTDFRQGCDPCPHKGRYPAAWIDFAAREFSRRRELARRNDTIFVAPSRMIRDRFVAEGFPADRFHVIHNPLDMEWEVSRAARQEARQSLDLPDDRTVVLFVAAETWIPRKGIDVFNSATRRLDDPGAWQLCVVGALDGRVRRMFANHPVPTRLIGSVRDRRRLARLYLASDVLVVPSRNESFGLIVIEAAAMGCRVVCSDLPVFREILGDHGLYFPVGDGGSCASALGSLGAGGLPEPTLDHAAEIRERFSLDRITDRYLSAYETVVGMADRS